MSRVPYQRFYSEQVVLTSETNDTKICQGVNLRPQELYEVVRLNRKEAYAKDIAAQLLYELRKPLEDQIEAIVDRYAPNTLATLTEDSLKHLREEGLL